MLYTIIVRTNHLDNGITALNFAQELLTQQHKINCIFFMFDAAYTGNSFINMPTDERSVSTKWRSLTQNNELDLLVCAASGLRRGIVEENLMHGFKMGSIGQLVECCAQADRVISL